MFMSLYSIFPFPDYVVYAVPAARMIVSSIIHDANTPFDKHYDNVFSQLLIFNLK